MGLDVEGDWDEIAALWEDGYRVIAPKRLVATRDEQQGGADQ